MKMILPNQSKGHYTPAVQSNGMLYVSGQLPIDKSGNITGDIVQQTKQALHNLEQILKETGISKNDVVQCRLYIPDIAYWDSVNQEYANFFGEHKPARTIVPCRSLRSLHYNALIEIDAIAEMRKN
ncbi:RidA family protein [Mannheimia sp. AT1]|uniref:RidA family protein n=1 Tax=Mannheimia cairinae TaxID=3025936 RepID=A0ABT5MLM5_9PAST|nr:RidA family protein [Mannheimia cairinae]MDD0822898.1 RidA family protein [Mannheimia cairinae]MDD0826074.1 RidA family protein [Mannheimia cairinae]